MSQLFVANWKMELMFNQALNWLETNSEELARITNEHQLVICPTHLELASAAQKIAPLHTPNLYIGAQNCSAFERGPYTGEISAQSLKEVGCTHCIVGHSERRTYFHETSEDVAHKTKQLFETNITPIVCVGETKKEYEAGIREEVVKEQLKPVLEEAKYADKDLCIAYEPVYAIGSGKTATNKDIEEMFDSIITYCKKQSPKTKITLLYGGSVTADTSKKLREIHHLGGFLIGGASLDFQELKKIVS